MLDILRFIFILGELLCGLFGVVLVGVIVVAAIRHYLWKLFGVGAPLK